MEVEEMSDNRMIRPVSDLRNNFAVISQLVHEKQQPVFLTKNGFSDMVVMSMEAYEKRQFESEIYCKLRQAEQEELDGAKPYSLKEVWEMTEKAIDKCDV